MREIRVPGMNGAVPPVIRISEGEKKEFERLEEAFSDDLKNMSAIEALGNLRGALRGINNVNVSLRLDFLIGKAQAVLKSEITEEEGKKIKGLISELDGNKRRYWEDQQRMARNSQRQLRR